MESSRADDDPVGVALFVDGPNVLREEFDVDPTTCGSRRKRRANS